MRAMLLRAQGPRAADQLGTRQSEAGSVPGEALREQRVLRVPGERVRLWSALGLEIEHGLCAPLQLRNRSYGAIELGRSGSEGEYSDGELKALEFICEQFSEFLAERTFSPDELP